MKLLVLSPQHFFINRGTPIAVKLLVENLETRTDLDQITLLTYDGGTDIKFSRVQQIRSYIPKFLGEIGAGLSFKKLIADFFLFYKTLVSITDCKPDLIHAVEESVFIALLLKKTVGIEYVYDMDSALAEQSADRWLILKPFLPLLNYLEKMAVRNALAVVPVCTSLADYARELALNQNIELLPDISFYTQPVTENSATENLRVLAGAQKDQLILLYVGNLEAYQGIDLLLTGISKLNPEVRNKLSTIIIGGSKETIENYTTQLGTLGIEKHVTFVGSRPLTGLSTYLTQANILASPRTQGSNTPMKLYSYLHSGRPVLATDLLTHTQVVNSTQAQLHKPDPQDLADKLTELIKDKALRAELGQNAVALIENQYTREAYKRRLTTIYDRIVSLVRK